MGVILFLWGACRKSTSSKYGLLQVASIILLLLFSKDLLGSERFLDLCLLGDVLVSLVLFRQWDLGLLYLHLGLLDLDFFLLQHLLLVLLRAGRGHLGLALFLQGHLCTGTN